MSKPKGYDGPQLEVVAQPGSIRWNDYYRELASKRCSDCNGRIGDQVFAMVWPDGSAAHCTCVETRGARERAMLTAGNVERAARKERMTIEGFRALPEFEQIRLVRLHHAVLEGS